MRLDLETNSDGLGTEDSGLVNIPAEMFTMVGVFVGVLS